MAVSDIEAVLGFLRKNGLVEAEAALMEDIVEKDEVGHVDLQRFLFPMVPAPPPIKVPVGRAVAADGGGGGGDDSSDDEFVSLDSSTTDFCSSEFTNPYGVRTITRASSQASSDRLSQFGTARDYHDLDLKNDLYWYKEEDEDYEMPHSFDNGDPYGIPSEDKFVTTLGTEKQSVSLEGVEKIDFIDKSWPLTSANYLEDGLQVKDRYDLVGGIELLQDMKAGNSYTHSPLLKEAELNGFHDCPTGSKHEQNFRSAEHGEYEDVGDIDGEDDANELLLYESKDDEYEVFNLRIIHRKNRTGFEENKDLPIVLNSIIASRYYVTDYLGSAAFSKVVQAHDLQTGIDVCLKIIKNDKDFFDQSLDEIKLLKFVNKYDPGDERHILRLYDYFYFQEHLIIVCELLRANLYEFQKYNRESGAEPYFTMNRLQIITRQCLEALEYLHGLDIIHCDLKPENILIKNYSSCEIKVIDLGSSCFQNDNLSLYVQSRSYRAPEVIIGLPYDQKIDLWSLGCILAELFTGDVLFPNDPLPILLSHIIGMFGPFDAKMLQKGHETDKYFTKEFDLYHINEETNEPEYSVPEETSLEDHLQDSDPLFTDFVKNLLQTNPKRRPTARKALKHPWLSVSYESNS